MVLVYFLHFVLDFPHAVAVIAVVVGVAYHEVAVIYGLERVLNLVLHEPVSELVGLVLVQEFVFADVQAAQTSIRLLLAEKRLKLQLDVLFEGLQLLALVILRSQCCFSSTKSEAFSDIHCRLLPDICVTL